MMNDNIRHFRILSIRVLRFHQEEPEEPIPAGADFAVNIKFTLQGDKDDNVIRIIFDVGIQKSDEATSPLFISIVTAMIFKFKEDDAFTINEKSKVIITAAVLNHHERGWIFRPAHRYIQNNARPFVISIVFS